MNSENGSNGNYTRNRNEKAERLIKEEKGTGNGARHSEAKEFQFGFGRNGSLGFILSLLAGVMTTIVLCSKDRCTAHQLPTFPDDLTVYIDFQVYSIYLGWLLFQVCLAIACSGPTVQGRPLRNGQCLPYKLNGFKMFMINMAIMLGLALSGIRIDILTEKLLTFYCISAVCALAVTIYLYGRSLIRNLPLCQLNSDASTGDSYHDFISGREINPRIESFDIKLFLFQLSHLEMVAISCAMMMKVIETSGEMHNPAGLLGIFCQIFWAAENLYFEECTLFTRTFSSDGVGLKLVYGWLVLTPFMMTLPQQYLFNNHILQNDTLIIVGFLLFVIGYAIYRSANSERYTFYRHPNHEDFAEMEVICCENGERLLAGGWWGWTRHPNYLGHIIMCSAISMTAGFGDALPHLFTVIIVIYLMRRAYHSEKRSRAKYGKMWDQYCERVKYRILKYIY